MYTISARTRIISGWHTNKPPRCFNADLRNIAELLSVKGDKQQLGIWVPKFGINDFSVRFNIRGICQAVRN